MGVEDHRLLLLRHGETEWSKSGQHTGRTEIDLTEAGRERARASADTLKKLDLDNPLVISSPRRRAIETAELAGLHVDEVTEDLAEWDYGRYEGLTTAADPGVHAGLADLDVRCRRGRKRRPGPGSS